MGSFKIPTNFVLYYLFLFLVASGGLYSQTIQHSKVHVCYGTVTCKVLLNPPHIAPLDAKYGPSVLIEDVPI